MIAIVVNVGIFLAAAAALFLTVKLLMKLPFIGLYLVGAFIVIAWELPDAPAILNAFGVQVKPEDAVAGVFTIAALASARNLRSPFSRGRLIPALILACVLASTAIGVSIYGPTGFNEARATIWLLAAVAWALTVDWELYQRQFRVFIVLLGVALSLIWVTHIIQYGWGGADAFVTTSAGILQTGRPLVSGQAITLALCGFYLLLQSGRGLRWTEIAVALGFLTLAALCLHRSVWVAIAAAGIGAVFMLRGRALARISMVFFYCLTALTVAWATGALDWLLPLLQNALTSDGTINARQDSWGVLIDEAFARGTWSVIFGQPFGFGFDRVVNSALITYNPHNWYVVLFLRLGAVGLIFTAVLLARSMYALARSHQGAMLASVLAISAYGFLYHLPWYLGPWLGVALWHTFQLRRLDSTAGYVGSARKQMDLRLELSSSRQPG